MDVIHKFLTWLDHNRYVAMAVMLLVGWLSYAVGCQSTTRIGDQELTRSGVESWLISEQARIEQLFAQAESEAKRVSAQAESALVDLEHQDQVKQQLFQALGGFATSAIEGTINPASIVGSLVSLGAVAFGVGAGLDNRRKDKEIIRRTNGTTPPTTPTPA